MHRTYGRRESNCKFSPTTVLLVALALSLPITGRALAMTIDIPPIADGMMWDLHSDGSFETLHNTSGNLYTDAFADGNGVIGTTSRSALEFDLSGVDTSLPLIAVYLGVNVSGTSTPPGITELSMTFDGYTGDAQITLSDATPIESTYVGGLTIPAGFPGFGPHLPQLDAGFVSQYFGADSPFGILTKSELGAGGISIDSTRAGNAAGHPFLRLEFVPEPTAAAMSLFGLVALSCVRRRKNR